MQIRILLADDHEVVRDGLCSLLQCESDMDVIGQAEDGRTAVRMAKQLCPDVVIMDIGMPDLNGIEATRQILANTVNVKVIALSMHSDQGFVAEMLKAAASGYLLKDCPFQELAHAIRTIIKKGAYLPASLTNLVIDNYVRNATDDNNRGFTILTAREREILQLMAEGKSTRHIATSHHISTKTVETHRLNIMEKLDIHSVAELTKYAIREGITSLE